MGQATEAEDYVRAAWVNRQDAEVGEHLGDLMAKRGDRKGAAKIYGMAIQTIPTYNGMGVRSGEPGVQELRLSEKIKGVGGAEGTSADTKMNRVLGLQGVRKVPLGATTSENGLAEYKLMLSPAGVERAVAMQKEMPKAETILKKGRFTEYWPAGSDARLVRTGYLNCHSRVCELRMEP